MNQARPARREAKQYLWKLAIQRLLGLLLYIMAAGAMPDLRGLVFFALYFLLSLISCIIMYPGHGETLGARNKRPADTKTWDKLLLPVYVLLAFYGIYVIAGLGQRFAWPQLPLAWFYAGIAPYVASGVLSLWAITENRFFESTSRLQSDRGQTVIAAGPYRLVRHPGYSAVILWAIAVALIFGALPVALTALLITALIIVRTYLEDSMLQRELDGYTAYARTVKYRLIPYIW